MAIGIGAMSLVASVTACTTGHPLISCGDSPRSSGPDAALVTLTLAAPSTGRSGTAIATQATLSASANVDDLSSPAAVVIVRTGRVVGAYRGAVGGTGLEAMAGAIANVPTEPLLLSGCPRGAIDGAHPDATRKPLPVGDYQVIATIDTGNYQKGYGQIASAPVPLRITD
jgi:hypothetical protein